ncbi:MAG: DNA recombination protein RmuC, partial [Candidatus Eremiobacteraeota bacterium]|nr:DNA recombination protein RmuC [Candidatus Eremiobacteraeota bacterium]
MRKHTAILVAHRSAILTPVRSLSVTASVSVWVTVLFAIAFVGGCAFVWLTAARGTRIARRDFDVRGRELSEALTAARIARAIAEAQAGGAELALAEVRSALQASETTADRLRTDGSRLEAALAAERQRVESLRSSEADVEARLQRVAKQYVDEARELLVTSAAERFGADAAAFREKVATTVAPLGERLDQLGTSLAALGSERTKDQAHVSTLLEALNGKMAGIDDATRRVERVLGNSQARGSWGEFELRRLLEIAGMTEHVSFDVQQSGYGADGSGRPDVVLRIPGNLSVPIDAKCPFSAYQEAVSADNDREREPLLGAAVAAVRAHIKALSLRQYHQAEHCVGWTIMFVPIEAMLSTLFALEPTLFDTARESRILIASPLTLLLYLEAFARGWAAQKQSDNAELI